MSARLFQHAVIEGLSPRDAELLAEIHRDAFQRNWSADDFAALLSEPTVFALGMRLRSLFGSGRLVGFVLVRFAADEAEILTIAVTRGHRRRGYGRLLMDDVLRRLYREHISALFLEVDRANAAAVGLYRRLGFVVAGERRNYYSVPRDGDGTALVMRLQVR
jgi:[ribosomal protein S18]-alanine N-acetyltransferase